MSIGDLASGSLIGLDWLVLGYFVLVNGMLTILLVSAAWEMRGSKS